MSPDSSGLASSSASNQVVAVWADGEQVVESARAAVFHPVNVVRVKQLEVSVAD